MVVRYSATLAINERIKARRAAGEPVLHLGFGEAGLPVLPELGAALADARQANSYGPVAGDLAARTAAAGFFGRRGLATQPEQVVFGPGSKALLFALLTVLPGDVVLPVPSWVSYAAQAALLHRRVIGVPIGAAAGGVPDPDRLRDAVRRNPSAGVLVLTVPDNPTGTLAPAELVAEVCAIADEAGLVVISDEIYRELCPDPARFASPTRFLPHRTIVTSGLSKSHALGGYRIGFLRLPTDADPRLHADLVGVASEVWSCLAGPQQRVAEWALTEPDVLVEHVAASRRLHNTVAGAVHQVFLAAGVPCRAPGGPFYLYPDFEPLRAELAASGVHTGQELADVLLDRHGVAVLAGVEFGDEPVGLRFRAATSLLYGESADQRWAALHGPDPLTLPWVADALAQLGKALAGLVGSG